MKLTQDLKQDIQCFVYFLFKGTFDVRLILADYYYLDLLLKNPRYLYSCFEIYAFDYQTKGEFRNPEKRKEIFVFEGQEYEKIYENPLVVDYIIALHSNEMLIAEALEEKAMDFNMKQDNFWIEFLKLSSCFCFNTFNVPVNNDYLKELPGNGTDATPVFAIWTNIIEVDENFRALNSEYSHKRANERIKLWDNIKPIVPFQEWELEQEIY